MTEDTTDYEHSSRSRRQSWYGTKPAVKRMLARPLPHLLMRQGVALLGDRIHKERLPAPARLDRVTASMGGATFVMLRPDRCIVAKELYWGDGKRPRAEDQLALDVFATLARDARTVIDVGAYTGLFSLLAGRASTKADVHAFEVVPEVAKAAQENVAANDLASRVTVHNAGVGAEGETVLIASGSGGSALPDFYSTRLRFSDGVPIPIRSLDAVTAEIEAAAPALIKIDVEGTEDVVLGNGRRFLDSHRPDVLCELLPDVSDAPAVAAALAPYGYRYLLVEAHHLSPREELVPDRRYRDWLFTTRSDADLRRSGLPVATG